MRLVLITAALLAAAPADAGEPPAAPNPKFLVDAGLIGDMRDILANEVVEISVLAQNTRYASIDAAGIERLDGEWVAEREADDKPLISATLSSPLSVYLTRTQARNLGLYAEIFVTDNNGLNVGQSSITSDFWQGDEAKFQKSFEVGPDAVFVDEAEWDEENRIWRAQVSMTVVDTAGAPIGAATFELNLTELQRRKAGA